VYLFDIFAALRPRLRIRQLDEGRQRLPDLIPTQFVFAAATMIHIGPFSAGNMIIERFCTADTVETKQFHRLPTGISLDSVRWHAGSDDWDERVDQLLDILRRTPSERTLVFVNSLHNCHVLSKFLKNAGWPVVSFMKGPMGRMGPRFKDAQRFAEGDAKIMIATEFGGRGLDWPDVDHVVNFQMPTSAVCWLHRVGRTGRIGRSGLVTNFVGTKDRSLGEAIQLRLAAGKDLHGAFSRRGSLPKQWKRGRTGEEEEGSSRPAEDGTSYHLDGGLELFHNNEAGSSGTGGGSSGAGGAGSGPGEGGSAEGRTPEGTIIGYLAGMGGDEEEVAGAVGRRLRQQAREAGGGGGGGGSSSSPPTRGRGAGTARAGDKTSARGMAGLEQDDALVKLRQQLLASDSESDDELEVDDDAERLNDDSRAERRSVAPSDVQGFSWDSLDASSGEHGPRPRRPLFEGGRPKADTQSDARRYARAEQTGGAAKSSSRKGGVRSANRIAAGNNYSSPDDELLL